MDNLEGPGDFDVHPSLFFLISLLTSVTLIYVSAMRLSAGLALIRRPEVSAKAVAQNDLANSNELAWL